MRVAFSICTIATAILLSICGCAQQVGSNVSYSNPTTMQYPVTTRVSSSPRLRFNSSISPAASSDLLTLLEGCIVVANDGQPLGMITTNSLVPNSLLNEFGKYGSEFSPTSIFNQFGKYGGEFSPLSPYNEFTRTPPQILTSNGAFVANLTKNFFLPSAIDPKLLIGLLKSSK